MLLGLFTAQGGQLFFLDVGMLMQAMRWGMLLSDAACPASSQEALGLFCTGQPWLHAGREGGAEWWKVLGAFPASDEPSEGQEFPGYAPVQKIQH